MKKILLTTLSALLLAGLLFAYKSVTENAEWAIDKSHSKLGFTATHLLVSDVDGRFNDFDAKITTTKEDFSDAVATMTAKVSSIDTDVEKRDADLKSPNYLDAATYPTITFNSKSFKKINDQNYLVTGDLTIHGVTKPVQLNAFCRTGSNPMSKQAVTGFKVTGKINRFDFGIAPNVPVAIISNEIEIFANVELSKKPATPTPTSMR